jgi:phage gp16-like protein
MTRALLAKVHIAKKELALSDESYRDILARMTGCQSSRDCTERQLEQLLDEFRRLGWKPKAGKGGSGFDKPHVRMIYALWKEAGKIGAVSSATKAALRSFVERQSGRAAPEFCSPADANSVTEALKAMIARAEDRQ